jgi:quinol monooxygenase YgiN
VVIIVAGTLFVAAAERERYLTAVADVTGQARAAAGCLDFVQAADPLDPSRINVYERWDSDEALLAFRGSGEAGAEPDGPELTGADVRKYRISAVEAP